MANEIKLRINIETNQRFDVLAGNFDKLSRSLRLIGKTTGTTAQKFKDIEAALNRYVLSSKSTISSAGALQAANTVLNKSLEQQKVEALKSSDAYTKLSASLRDNKQALNENVKAQQLQLNINRKADGSVDKLKLQLRQLREAYNKLGEAQKKGISGQNTLSEISKLEKALALSNKSLEQQKQEALKSSDAYTKLSASLRNTKQEINENVKAQQLQLNINRKADGSVEKLKLQLRQLREEYSKLSTSQREGLEGFDIRFKAEQIGKDLKDANDEFTQATKGFDDNSKKSVGAFQRLGLGSLGAIAAFEGLRRAIVNVGETLGEFERNISILGAVTGEFEDGLPTQELTDLETKIKELGATTQFTASDVASLATELARLGFNTEQIDATLGNVLNLALIAGESTSRAAEVLGSTINAFGLEFTEATRVVDLLAKAFSSSALDLTKFDVAVGTVGAVAKQSGIEIEEVAAVMGVLSNAGFDASIAATAFRNILIRSAEAGKDYRQALGEVADATDSTLKAFELFGVRGAPQATVIADAFNTGEIQKLAGDFRKAQDDAFSEEAVGFINQDFQSAINEFKSALEGLTLTIGDVLKPALTGILEVVTLTLQSFRDFFETIGQGLGVIQESSTKTEEFNASLSITTTLIGIFSTSLLVASGRALVAFIGSLTTSVLSLFSMQGALVGASGALGIFRFALASTGIGALVIAVGFLIAGLIEAGIALSKGKKNVDIFGKAVRDIGNVLRVVFLFVEGVFRTIGAIFLTLTGQIRKAQKSMENFSKKVRDVTNDIKGLKEEAKIEITFDDKLLISKLAESQIKAQIAKLENEIEPLKFDVIADPLNLTDAKTQLEARNKRLKELQEELARREAARSKQIADEAFSRTLAGLKEDQKKLREQLEQTDPLSAAFNTTLARLRRVEREIKKINDRIANATKTALEIFTSNLKENKKALDNLIFSGGNYDNILQKVTEAQTRYNQFQADSKVIILEAALANFANSTATVRYAKELEVVNAKLAQAIKDGDEYNEFLREQAQLTQDLNRLRQEEGRSLDAQTPDGRAEKEAETIRKLAALEREQFRITTRTIESERDKIARNRQQEVIDLAELEIQRIKDNLAEEIRLGNEANIKALNNELAIANELLQIEQIKLDIIEEEQLIRNQVGGIQNSLLIGEIGRNKKLIDRIDLIKQEGGSLTSQEREINKLRDEFAFKAKRRAIRDDIDIIDQKLKNSQLETTEELELRKELSEKELELQELVFERRKTKQEEARQEQLEILNTISDNLQSSFTNLDSVFQSLSDNRLKRIQREADLQILLAGNNNEKIQKIEAAREKKLREERKKTFEQSKKLQLAALAIQTATGIVNILSAPTTIPIPFDAIVKAAQIAALVTQSAASAASISSQTFAEGGYTGSSTNKKDKTGRRPAGIVHNDEWVANTEVLRHPEGAQLIAKAEMLRRRIKGGSTFTKNKGYFAEGGFTGASFVPTLPAVASNSTPSVAGFTDEQIEVLAETLSVAVAQGSRQGLVEGRQDENRLSERLNSLNNTINR